jgi:hypothetical protein
MIIEIKDLPPGRKVKQISVDVIFEEDGVKVSQQNITSTDKLCKPNDPFIHESPGEPQIEKHQDIKPPEQDFEQREAKDVPDEMLNMEF